MAINLGGPTLFSLTGHNEINLSNFGFTLCSVSTQDKAAKTFSVLSLSAQ